MADVSFSVNQGFEFDGVDSNDVVEGTDAPTTGDLEVSFDATKFTQLQLREALDLIYRFAANSVYSTSTSGV